MTNSNTPPLLGVDYYPEQWPQQRWETDAKTMHQLGLDVVRLGEFAWSLMEPYDNQFEWEWLDRAIETLASESLHIVLGTPTAAPPAWLVRSHPEVLIVDAEGRRREFGSRCHYCHSSPLFAEHVRRIVAAMAERYGHHASVIGWQLDNEFGNHGSARCYCSACIAAFRQWLQKRYGTLAALNGAWGTNFWSQTYTSWDEIHAPILTPAQPNPSHVLDYYRFSSEATAKLAQLQIDTLRPRIQGQFITTNFMGTFDGLDYHKLAQNLDFVSWDNYPTGYAERVAAELYMPDAPRPPVAYDVGDPYVTGFCHDLTRGLKHGQPFWVMEQQCGHINWGIYNPTPYPGTTRIWTWHNMIAGADAVVYFRWRASVMGQEQMHSGLLRHDASPDQGYEDLMTMKNEAAMMRSLQRGRVPAQAALLFSYEDLWAISLQPHRQDFSLWRHLFTFYRALQEAGVVVDIVGPEADLRGYRLVIAPTLFLMDKALETKLSGFVQHGGTLMTGVRSGFKQPNNLVIDKPLPGLLQNLTGVTVERWHALPPGQKYTLEGDREDFFDLGSATVWAEALISADPATELPVRYGGGPLSGNGALAYHAYGQGQTVYLGWWPDHAQACKLVNWLIELAGVPAVGHLPPGIIASSRIRTDGGEVIAFFNFTDKLVDVRLPDFKGHDALSEEQITDHLEIDPRNLRLLMRAPIRRRRVEESRVKFQGQRVHRKAQE